MLARARERAQDKPRVWMKSAKLEREQGRRQDEKAILEEGRRRIQTQLAIFCTDVTAETELLARKYSKDLLYLSYMDSKEYAILHNESYYGSSDDDFDEDADGDEVYDDDESDSDDDIDSDK